MLFVRWPEGRGSAGRGENIWMILKFLLGGSKFYKLQQYLVFFISIQVGRYKAETGHTSVKIFSGENS